MANIDHYRQVLRSLEQEVTHRINSIDKDIRYEGMTADWTEQASERENDEVLESLGNSSEQELQLIKHALQRIEAGHYFECENCGDEIPTARLDLLPFIANCVNCAEKTET